MNKQVQLFCDWYGDGSDGACPTPCQWEHILSFPEEQPITLINFFKLREKAVYPDIVNQADQAITGQDAFSLYASVSIPEMERVSGRFLHVGPFSGVLIGMDEAWDIVAIGAYPNLASLVSLYSNLDYRQAFLHRTAACLKQKVLIAKND